MLILSAGTGAANLIGVAVLPLLTRLYSPDDFGLLAVYTAIVTFLVPAFSLYGLAIPLPRTTTGAANAAALSLVVLAASTATLALVLSLWAPTVLSALSADGLLPYWWLLVLGVIGGGIYELASQWATRVKAFKQLAVSSFTQAFWGSATQIILGLAGYLSVGLLAGALIKQSAGSIPLLRRMLHDIRPVIHTVRLRSIKKLLWHYSDFPIYRLPSQVLMAFSGQALPLFSAAVFGIHDAGQVSLAMLTAAVPLRLIGANVGRAYYAEIAALGRKNREQIYHVAIGVVKKLAILSILPGVILYAFGEAIFVFAFGTDWKMAGLIASNLSPYVVTSFISIPIVHTLNVIGQQKYYLRINAARAAGTVVLFCFCFLLNLGAVATVTLYSLMLSVHFLVTLWSVLRLILRHPLP